MFVKNNPKAYAKCIKTENWRTEKAAFATQPLIHTCHAGVTDLILPVRVDGRQVGAVFLGQVFVQSESRIRELLRRLWRQYHYHEEDLKVAAETVPALSIEVLRSFQPLLVAIADYLEQAEQLLALQWEREQWTHGKRAYEELPEDELKVEDLPTPLLDRLEVEVKGKNAPRVLKAIGLIRKNYWENPSCEEMARWVAMSQSHFSREFHRKTGMTYRQCLLECRLNAAYYLIKRNRYTIEEAAVLVGYEDACSLQRAFKTFTGLTPYQFLRSYPRAYMVERFERQRPEAES